MSASADKGDHKREIEQSPMKKKFRDSTISRENLDDAIANGVKLALKEQQSTLNSVVNSAVRDAMDSMLIPALRELREDIQVTDKSVKELREEFEAIVTAAKQTCDRVDSVQAESLSGDMSCVGVNRSRTITIFCCSVRPMFSVMCGLNCSLFMVVGCSCFHFYFLQQTFILLFILTYF